MQDSQTITVEQNVWFQEFFPEKNQLQLILNGRLAVI